MIIPMSIGFATQISGWTYENEYLVYSFHQDDDTVKELMNGEYYVCVDQFNNLSGYFCFGKSAQIPTIEKGVYNPEMLDIGLGYEAGSVRKLSRILFCKIRAGFCSKQFSCQTDKTDGSRIQYPSD